jgi:hypothetical protein
MVLTKLISKHLKTGLIYSFIAILVIGPMIRNGFILVFDMVFTPKIPKPHTVDNNYIFNWLIHLFNFILSSQVIEKILIFAILFICGYGMHYLINTKSELPKYFAGLFYTVNPFTYERWMAGQYLVLAGYACLPLILRQLINFYYQPNLKSAVKLLFLYFVVISLSLQMFVFALGLGAILLIAQLLEKSNDREYCLRLIKYLSLIAIGFLIINSFWLISALTGHSSINKTINGVSSRDLKAFATSTNSHTGLFFNVISLYGFWLERYNRFKMPNHILSIWIAGFTLIAILVILGGINLKRKQSKLAVCLAISAFFSLIMSLGPNSAVTGPLVKTVILHIPFMKGFREPEKCSAVLALTYVYFAAYGLDYILDRIPKKASLKRNYIIVISILLPVFYVSTMLFGFDNQLKPVQYPRSWYSFENQIKIHPPTGKILFLPWNEYTSYNFSPYIIANPASDFFYSGKVIYGTNAQFGGVDDPNPTPTSLYIENEILAHTNQENLGHKLANKNIEYILLARGYNYKQYSWLNKQSDLQKLSRRQGLIIYKNGAYHG